MPYPLTEGGCQCGAVRYRITSDPVFLSICHCKACQMQSGSAFGMSLRVRTTDIDLLSGNLKVWSRPADSGATVDCFFCETCGTRIWHAPSAAVAFVHIKPGTLDDPLVFRPQYASYTALKADWFDIHGLDATWEGMPDSAQRTGKS